MIKSYSNKAIHALHAIVAISSLAFSAYAHATLLQIDSSTSQITYRPARGIVACDTDPSGVIRCAEPPPAQTAALSGRIDLNITHEHWEFGTSGAYVTDRDLLWLSTTGLSAGALTTKFPLTGRVGIISGGRFEARDDPCFLDPFPGLCGSIWWSLVHWGADGSWDGHTLSWNGYSSEDFGDSVSFTINAVALPVSEPGTLTLMLLALVGFGTKKSRRLRQGLA